MDLKYLQIFGLLCIMASCISIFLWIFRPGSKKHYEKQSKIPLKEEYHEEK